MKNDSITIEATTDFVNDAKIYFEENGINMQETVIEFISQIMKGEEVHFPILQKLSQENVTPEIIEAWENFQKLDLNEIHIHTNKEYAIS